MYTDETNDLCVGEWRNGLSKPIADFVAEAEKREKQGFRQLYMEATVVALAHLLDGYDELVADLLMAKPRKVEATQAE